MELEQGDLLEGSEETWEILRFLGKGKCCSVYETCRARQDGRRQNKAALKVYKKDKKYASAGMNEVHVLQMLHKEDDGTSVYGQLFIVQLLDIFRCEGHLCLLNPLLSFSLHWLIAKTGWSNGLPVYVVQKCCKELACGLQYLREKRIIHGDIKLTNIMWDANSEVLQFVDFGLSFVEGKQPPQQIQSPGFQAPEVQEWNRNIGSQKVRMCSSPCDVWGVACVLYLLYTGQQLFHADMKLLIVCQGCHQGTTCIHSKTVQNHLSIQSSNNKEIAKDHHEAISDLLSRMLKCRPEERLKPDAILGHSFLSPQLAVKRPTLVDLLLLPTRVLQLTNMFEDISEFSQSEEYEDFLDDIKQECSKFGAITSLCLPFMKDKTKAELIGKVFIEFERTEDCTMAQQALSGKTFNERPVITSFFPVKDFRENKFY